MRYIILATILGGLLIVGMFGSRGHKFNETPVEIFNDMDRQARVNAQSSSDFFSDGLGSREPVEGTFPIGFSIPDKPFSEGDAVEDGFSLVGTYFNSGRIGDFYGDGLPKEIKLDKNLLERGKQRYGIYCAVCHAESGDGNGVVRPFGNGGQIPIANLHEARFAETSYPDGEVFSVITMGKGLMGGYGGSIPAKDRWAIIAYVRALQKAKLDSEKTVEGNSPASTEDKPSEN